MIATPECIINNIFKYEYQYKLSVYFQMIFAIFFIIACLLVRESNPRRCLLPFLAPLLIDNLEFLLRLWRYSIYLSWKFEWPFLFEIFWLIFPVLEFSLFEIGVIYSSRGSCYQFALKRCPTSKQRIFDF